MFKAIDENGDGSVSFDEWLGFAYKNYQVGGVGIGDDVGGYGDGDDGVVDHDNWCWRVAMVMVMEMAMVVSQINVTIVK